MALPTDPAEREKALEQLFPPLEPLPPEAPPGPGPLGRPLGLVDLQRLAVENSPTVRQAAADVDAARGAAVQARLYPNPSIGYQGDQIGSGGTAGQQGGFFEQVIKTGGKRRLQEAIALADLRSAEVAYTRARFDLLTQVRTQYFAVLVARENSRVARALAAFAEEVYRVQVDQLRAKQLAPYEPLQLRSLVFQARGAVVQAQNRTVAAWRQLAAALGLPAMPPAELAGSADLPPPPFDHAAAAERVLGSHTDVRATEVAVERARLQLRLAQVTPIPDVSVHVAVQRDYGSDPPTTQASVQMGVAVPVWDNNRGNIFQARAQLMRANEEAHRVASDLSGRLAVAFEQYETNRALWDYYRNQILPDQVRAYRGLIQRLQQDPAVTFLDVFTAQQTLTTTVTTYMTTLNSLWSAVVGVADLLQVDDLLGDAAAECAATYPVAPQALPGPNPGAAPLPDPPGPQDNAAEQPARLPQPGPGPVSLSTPAAAADGWRSASTGGKPPTGPTAPGSSHP
jgi:cobalt-zinc-cadmium efflux system outer membrane protein